MRKGSWLELGPLSPKPFRQRHRLGKEEKGSSVRLSGSLGT